MAHQARLRGISAAGAAAIPDRGPPVRRGTADARDRPYADGQSCTVAAGRAKRRVSADHRAADRRATAPIAWYRCYRPDRGAEYAFLPWSCEPCYRHRQRPDRIHGDDRGLESQRQYSPALPCTLAATPCPRVKRFRSVLAKDDEPRCDRPYR